MREICDLQVGRCGSQIGRGFWEMISDEHGLNNEGIYIGDSDLQLDGMNVYFKETVDGNYVPRSVLANSIPNSPGAGCGLGMRILSRIREEYPDRNISTFSILPSRTMNDAVVEPYQTAMTLHRLIEDSDQTFCMDNQTLHYICSTILRNPWPTYFDLNRLVSVAMSGVTASMRFPGQLNSDLRKMTLNMVPYPRLHFLVTGIAPIIPSGLEPTKTQVSELVQEMFKPTNVMMACDHLQGRSLSLAATFRGVGISLKEVENDMISGLDKVYQSLEEWVPSKYKISVCSIPPGGYRIASIFISNTTSIKGLFQRFAGYLSEEYKRKTSLHWYTTVGVDENQFKQAESDMNNLIAEYHKYQELSAE